MTDYESCLTCTHINKKDITKCDAFPGGIPFLIISGGVEHTKPFDGDNGIVYEPNDSVKKKQASERKSNRQ